MNTLVSSNGYNLKGVLDKIVTSVVKTLDAWKVEKTMVTFCPTPIWGDVSGRILRMVQHYY